MAKYMKDDASYERVSHPNHYNMGGIEVQDVITSYDLSWNLGNVIKYVLRAGKKPGSPLLEDLNKAKQYLEFEIDRVSK